MLTLDQLLADGPADAVELTKKLLVLDPLRRLNAKEAIQNCYVERFRKANGENELSRDILTPFRDDIQLTVNEYRAKIYEIMSTSGGGNNNTAAAAKGGTTGGAVNQRFKNKTKKFLGANKSAATIPKEDHSHSVDEKGHHRINHLLVNCNCPFEKMAAEKEKTKSLQHKSNGSECQSYGMQARMRNNKVASMPAVAEASNYKTLSKTQGHGREKATPAQLLQSSSLPIAGILPRNDDVMRMNMTNSRNGHNYTQQQIFGVKSDQERIKGGTRNGGYASDAVPAVPPAMPQRCYENRLKVLEEKIRRHKQEMTDFLRVGSNNKKLASIQAAGTVTKPVQAVVLQNGRLVGEVSGGGGGGGLGRRIESKLSCSSSSTTSGSNQSLKIGSQGKPAFRCGCTSKPIGVGGGGAGGGLNGLSRNLGGGSGKLFEKSSSAAGGLGGGGGGNLMKTGFGVISATDLYKLRSAEIINQS